MAHVYEKQTKETVDFPAYILCFLGIIMDKLEFYGLIDGKPGKLDSDAPETLVIPIVSRKYPYCFDGIELIRKTMKRRGFDCTMAKYKVDTIKDPNGNPCEGYSYEYKITKAK